MYFVKEPGVGKVLERPCPSQQPWTVALLKTKLIEQGVWQALIPGNVENWFEQVIRYAEAGEFSFEAFVETFGKSRVSFQETLRLLHK